MAGRNKTQAQELVPLAPPRRVEVRIDGRVSFVNDCYDVKLTLADDAVSLSASLHPTMVPTPKRPPQRFEYDPRDGEEPILKVHNGSRQVAAPSPKEG